MTQVYRNGQIVEVDDGYIPATPRYATAAEAKAAMVKWINNLTNQVKSEYPDIMPDGWIDERAAARAVKHDINEPDETKHIATPEQLLLVTAEGAAKGRTPEEHADAILLNAQKYWEIRHEVNKLFLATDAALEAATDPAQYETILNAAIAQAAPLAEAYGLTA